MRDYFEELITSFSEGWNRFWFEPSDPARAAALRIVAGVMALYYVVTFTPDLTTFFASDGMLPVATVENVQRIRQEMQEGINPFAPGAGPYRFSYLDYCRSHAELWVAHVVGIAIVALYAAGAFTRVTSILALVVILSYYHRAPVLASQLEPVLAFTVFYLCFAPAGARWSVDAFVAKRKGRPAPSPSPAATVSIRLIQVHVALVYFMMAIAKIGDGLVWQDGSATWWLMSRPESRLLDLTWLHAFPLIVYAWSHAIVLIELLYPILIWNRWARPLLIAASTLMWLSLIPITGFGAFALLMIGLNVAFLPDDCLVRYCTSDATSTAPWRLRR